MHSHHDQFDTEAMSLAAPAPGNDDQEPAITAEDGDLDDLCERWVSPRCATALRAGTVAIDRPSGKVKVYFVIHSDHKIVLANTSHFGPKLSPIQVGLKTPPT